MLQKPIYALNSSPFCCLFVVNKALLSLGVEFSCTSVQDCTRRTFQQKTKNKRLVEVADDNIGSCFYSLTLSLEKKKNQTRNNVQYTNEQAI